MNLRAITAEDLQFKIIAYSSEEAQAVVCALDYSSRGTYHPGIASVMDDMCQTCREAELVKYTPLPSKVIFSHYWETSVMLAPGVYLRASISNCYKSADVKYACGSEGGF